MESAIRVNTLVKKTTEAATLLHESAPRNAVLRRKKDRGPAGRKPGRVTQVAFPSRRAQTLPVHRVPV